MNKKRIIFSSLCVILLVALVGGTLSWFYVNEDVSVTYGDSIFCEAGDSLEIALVDQDGKPGPYSSLVDYSAGNYDIIDISGNGEMLYRPKEVDEKRNPVDMYPAISSFESAEEYDYIEMKLSFRSVSEMNVYFDGESFIEPIIREGDAEANIYGRVSPGYIAGAMRVAVLDEEGNLKMLWAPNSKYHLYMNERGTYSFNENSTPETDYYYFDAEINPENGEETIVQRKVSAQMYANKQFVVDSTGADKNNSGNSPVLVSLRPETLGGYDEETVTIRIWFEGTDREAHQALAGGNVNAKLKFVGIRKPKPNDENYEESKSKEKERREDIENISFNAANGTFTGLKKDMVFTYDGKTWISYVAGSSVPRLSEKGTSVFIKYPETATNFETPVKMFTLE